MRVALAGVVAGVAGRHHIARALLREAAGYDNELAGAIVQGAHECLQRNNNVVTQLLVAAFADHHKC